MLKRKVNFFTLGCKVNQYETQALSEKLVSSGWIIADSDADLCVINTCTVTSSADKKCRDMIAKAKARNPQAKIAVCGCLAELNRSLIEAEGVDYIIPQSKKHLLDSIVSGKDPKRLSCEDIWSLKITGFFNHRAFLKVQDGCDNYCSFCKIPYLRGPSRSRPEKDVLGEISLLSCSHKEIVLCGINLAMYGRDLLPESSLAALVEKILSIDSLGRLRLSSLEPSYLDSRLLGLAGHKKLCPHFHLPFQSGDNRILQGMNKKETAQLYIEKVERIKRENHTSAISADIMLGFPEETDNSFENTISFLSKIRPMRLHIFTFSPRDNTVMASSRILDSRVVKKRHKILKELSKEWAFEYMNKFLGKELTLVIDTSNDSGSSGYSENYIRIHIPEKIGLGEMVKVRMRGVVSGKAVGRTVRPPKVYVTI